MLLFMIVIYVTKKSIIDISLKFKAYAIDVKSSLSFVHIRWIENEQIRSKS